MDKTKLLNWTFNAVIFIPKLTFFVVMAPFSFLLVAGGDWKEMKTLIKEFWLTPMFE